ncbi:MAG: hydroxymethylbilane synthase [Desulfurellaceae bacterium]|nr:hydroxymethylbilane synthase [Desulfurellaceae bacterium]
MQRTVRIGTRGSTLAVWQAGWVKQRLEAHWPDWRVELVPITTSGDRIQHVSLARIGGKGLFVKEIEQALLAGTVDLAVHSVKDLPAELPSGLVLSTIPEREDPRDVLISATGSSLADLPQATRVGTSSLRRQALLLHLRPDLRIEVLRGNVETRLRRQLEGRVDATILAAAGLKRLSLRLKNGVPLDAEEFLPAIGQGALGIEIRAGDAIETLLAPLHHAETAWAIKAERAFLSGMGGSCRTPLAARATVANGSLRLTALVASPDGKRLLRHEISGPTETARQIGTETAALLLDRGGRDILAALEATEA